MLRVVLAALVIGALLLPQRAEALDTTGYRWFGCEVGLTLGGVGLALTLPHVGKLESDDPNRFESDGAPVFAAIGLTALALGLCPAGLFTADAIAEATMAEREVGYGLAGGGLSAFGGALLGYGLGQALDASSTQKNVAAGVGGVLGAVGGYLVAGRVGADPVLGDAIQAPLFAYAALFILTGIITNVIVAATAEDGAPPHPALLIAPAVAGLGGFYLTGALTR
ncbi:MAG: hypothetical protein RIT81_04275 [Deltaproteobacteria bacterium]